MFLGTLTQEVKTKFMEFVYSIANIDGEYAEDEQELIKNYQVELNMPVLPEITDSIYGLIEFFAAQPENVKKVIAFEIYGLILADELISPREQNILDAIEDNFGLDASMLAKIKGLAKELQDVYGKIYDMLS
jgi:uncharacterized tellurite resistance protein B-like protein